MLPLPIQFLIATIAAAINQRKARQLEYAQEEVRTLKEALAAATGTERIRFTEAQRRRLTLMGKALTPRERTACCQVVRPETIVAWFQRLAAAKYDSSKVRGAGRPRKGRDVRRLVVKLAQENPRWGYTKIRDALRGLGIEIGRTAIADILGEAGIEPAPGRRKRRRTRSAYCSSLTMTWSKQSLQRVPMARSAKGLAVGARGGVARSLVPSRRRRVRKPANRRPKTPNGTPVCGYPLLGDCAARPASICSTSQRCSPTLGGPLEGRPHVEQRNRFVE
jgi:transposase